MLDKLEEFAGLLRRNHIRVSTSEVIDAATAARAIGLDSGADLRAALAAALVKKAGDRATFEELYTLYFLRGSELLRDLEAAPLVSLLAEMGLSEDDIERILATLADQAHALSAAARVGLGLRSHDAAGLLRLAGIKLEGTRIVSPLHVGYHAHQVLAALGLADAERELDALLRTLGGALGDVAAEALRAVIKQNLQALRQAVRRHVQDEFEKQNREWVQDLRLRSLAEKPFASLTEDEIRKLREEIQKLARKLRAQASLRPKLRRRGRLDVRPPAGCRSCSCGGCGGRSGRAWSSSATSPTACGTCRGSCSSSATPSRSCSSGCAPTCSCPTSGR